MRSHSREGACLVIWMVFLSSANENELVRVIVAQSCGCTVWTQNYEPHSPGLARSSVLIQAIGFLPSQFPHLQTSENTYPRSSSKVKCILSSKGKLLSIYTQHECVSTQRQPPGFPESPPWHAGENWPGCTMRWHLSCVFLVLVRNAFTAKSATLSALCHLHTQMRTGNNFLDMLEKGL